MISRARLKANRANARRSTGPKTPQGKRRSSKNALKHGFRSKSLTSFLTEDDTEALFQNMLGGSDNIASISARKAILETQAALRSIEAAWDRKLDELNTKHDVPIDHRAVSLELQRLSLYARRIRALQRKAIKAHYASEDTPGSHT